MSPTRCMHLMCTKCLDDMGRASGNRRVTRPKCPMCRDTVDGWIPNTFVKKLISSIRVKCQYNCDKIVDFCDYKSHLASCVYRPATCPNLGCGWSGTWAGYLDHFCIYQLTPCEYCKNTFHAGAITEHAMSCNYAPVACGMCSEQVPGWMLFVHKCKPPPPFDVDAEANSLGAIILHS